jgi:hypothetical protein
MKTGATPIDPEIRSLVLILNRVGLKTLDSCAGHARTGYKSGVIITESKSEKEKDFSHYYFVLYMGHIKFDRSNYNSSLTKKTMRDYGLTGIKELSYNPKEVCVVFDPIGSKYTQKKGMGIMLRIEKGHWK